MEAFGLAAGVLQVAGFGAEVGSTLLRCAKKLHNASKELESIAGQVETTALSLKRVDELLKDPATKALHTPKLYEDTNTVSQGCHEVFRELDKSVKAYEAKSTSGKMRLLSRTKWLFDSGRLAELGQVLRRYNDVLHLMVSVMTIVEGRRAATKVELQALEANLQVLALSNKDLSDSNKTLTETIAAISRAPNSPFLSPRMSATPTTQRPMMFSTFALVPLSNASVIPTPADETSDHLQRCMHSVQELARTIACAMDTWHGRGLLECSDIHGTYAKVSANLEQLPANAECMRCIRRTYKSTIHNPPSRVAVPSTCTCDLDPEPAKRRRTSGAPYKLAVTCQTQPSDIVDDAAGSLWPCYPLQGDLQAWGDGSSISPPDLVVDFAPPALVDAPISAHPGPYTWQSDYEADAALEQNGLISDREGLEAGEANSPEPYPERIVYTPREDGKVPLPAASTPSDGGLDAFMARELDAFLAQKYAQIGAGQVVDVEPAELPKEPNKDAANKSKRTSVPTTAAVVAGPSTASEMPAFNTREESEHPLATREPTAIFGVPVDVVESLKSVEYHNIQDNRDGLPIRMPADKKAMDHEQHDRMQIDMSTGPPQDRRYQTDRSEYTSDLSHYADTRGNSDVRAPRKRHAQDDRRQGKEAYCELQWHGDDMEGDFAVSEPKYRRGRPAPPGGCRNCKCAESVEWRRGPDGPRTLCDSCCWQYQNSSRKGENELHGELVEDTGCAAAKDAGEFYNPDKDDLDFKLNDEFEGDHGRAMSGNLEEDEAKGIERRIPGEMRGAKILSPSSENPRLVRRSLHSSPARGRNGSLSSSNCRSSSNASDQPGDYIHDLTNPEKTSYNGAESPRQQKHPATFQCTLCPKRFTQAYYLRSHLRRHTDERPSVYKAYGKAFARKQDRKRHEGLHSSEEKSVCRPRLASSQSACTGAPPENTTSDVGNDEDFADNDDIEKSEEKDEDDNAAGQLSAVQALLNRWLDSSASALLLKDDEPVT